MLIIIGSLLLTLISIVFGFFFFNKYNKEKKLCEEIILNKENEIIQEIERRAKLRKEELDKDFLVEQIKLEGIKNEVGVQLLNRQEILKKEKEVIDGELQLYKLSRNQALDKEFDAKVLKLDEEFNNFLDEKSKEQNEIIKEIEKQQLILDDHRARVEVINEAIRREKEIHERKDFYRIVIPASDQNDIQLLLSFAPQLRKREAINKLIWDVYIQRPTSEMIKRVTNNDEASGIYKITYIPTGESYIGKTTNFKKRWTDHIKTVVGLDGAAHSTLHTHMETHGLWNYSFEILEKVPKDNLAAREAYWIDFYQTTKQLNMKQGSK